MGIVLWIWLVGLFGIAAYWSGKLTWWLGKKLFNFLLH